MSVLLPTGGHYVTSGVSFVEKNRACPPDKLYFTINSSIEKLFTIFQSIT